jgi:hypothetical protein
MEIEAPQLAIAWQNFIIGFLAERIKNNEADTNYL